MRKQILDLSEDFQVKDLYSNLLNSTNNEDIELIFINHCKNNSIDDLISNQLLEIADDNKYSAPNILTRSSFRIKNDENFIHTLRYLEPDYVIENPTIWNGYSQLISIRGKGNVKILYSIVPYETDINIFHQGVKLKQIKEKIIKDGEIIANWNSHQIIQVIEIDSPVMIESLEIKNPLNKFYWSFDLSQFSVAAHSSNLLFARLKIIIDLAIELEVDLPQHIYEIVFEQGHGLIQFRAIEAMLLEGHVDTQKHFERALKSEDPILSDLARNLHNKLYTSL